MKTSRITCSKNYRDRKFSYPKVKRNKNQRELNDDINTKDNKEIQDSDDFWSDCK